MAPVLARNVAENVVPVLKSVADFIPAVNNKNVLRESSPLLGLYVKLMEVLTEVSEIIPFLDLS